jgi:hypothetical protein
VCNALQRRNDQQLPGQGLLGEQQKVVDCLAQAAVPLAAAEVAQRTGKSCEAAKKLLQRMSDEGRIKGSAGQYECWPSDRTPPAGK